MAKMPFSSLILRNTISTNPLARLLLIACWRCIVFLILWDMERKRSRFELESVLIIISNYLEHIEKKVGWITGCTY